MFGEIVSDSTKGDEYYGPKINVKLILELRSNGMGRNAIARTRHISVNSVGDVFHKADENGSPTRMSETLTSMWCLNTTAIPLLTSMSAKR